MRFIYFSASSVFACLGLSAQCSMAQTVAQAESSQAGQLLEVIEVQQRRLNEQEREIAEQKRAQQELRRQVQALEPRAPVSVPTTAEPLVLSPTEETELKKLLDRQAKAAQQNWPGSFYVFGSKTRFKISGFAALDAIHDNHAIATPTAFVTSAIATRDGIPAQGSDGLTHFSVQTSRLAVESRSPVGRHKLTTYISFDMFGDFFSDNADPRLRQAYGKVSDILFGGDLLLGQTWTNFVYLPAFPNTLDFEGPSAAVAPRRPLVGWSRALNDCLKLNLSLEAPTWRSYTTGGRPFLLDSVPEWPDTVAALAWERDSIRIQGAIVGRDLRASVDNLSPISDGGWGANVSGRINMPWSNQQDFVTFGYVDGEGVGGLLNDAPPDAIYDFERHSLESIGVRGGWLGFQHWWSPDFYSVVTYSELNVDNDDWQLPSAYRRGKYSSANLVWTPFPKWLFGFEALYGSREDKDDRRGSVTRFQFTSRFTF